MTALLKFTFWLIEELNVIFIKLFYWCLNILRHDPVLVLSQEGALKANKVSKVLHLKKTDQGFLSLYCVYLHIIIIYIYNIHNQ